MSSDAIQNLMGQDAKTQREPIGLNNISLVPLGVLVVKRLSPAFRVVLI
jgi:hypothetical protein